LPAEDVAPARHHRQTVNQPPVPLTDTQRILLMDDEEMIQQLGMDLFAYLNYAIDVVSDGREAIARYSAMLDAGKRYLLVILDLTVVGGMGGLPAVTQLLEMDKAVRAIVSSGYSDDPVVTDYRKHGFVGVLAKPYTIDELEKLLNRIKSEL